MQNILGKNQREVDRFLLLIVRWVCVGGLVAAVAHHTCASCASTCL